MADTDRLAALLADAARPLSVSEDGMVGIPSLTEMAARLIAAGVTLQPAAPAEGLPHRPDSFDDVWYPHTEPAEEPKMRDPGPPRWPDTTKPEIGRGRR